MAKRRSEEEHAGNHERWLLTYSDLITLLMIFFVVLYSMGQIDNQKFIAVANALGIAMGDGPRIVEANIGLNGILEGGGKGQENQGELDQTEKQIEEYVETNNLGSLANIYMDERGLVVSLNEVLLFELGSADVDAHAKEILEKIGDMIAKLPNYVTVEGFTDDLPIKTAKFPSNWELAAQRAINVSKILIADGVSPEKISARSYGEFRPAYPNTTSENRKKNRRVDIIILKSEHNKLEPQMQNPGAAQSIINNGTGTVETSIPSTVTGTGQ